MSDFNELLPLFCAKVCRNFTLNFLSDYQHTLAINCLLNLNQQYLQLFLLTVIKSLIRTHVRTPKSHENLLTISFQSYFFSNSPYLTNPKTIPPSNPLKTCCYQLSFVLILNNLVLSLSRKSREKTWHIKIFFG